jgi:hypothetical protein
MVFKDLRPQVPVHLLILPRKQIPTLNDTAEDSALIGQMLQVGKTSAMQSSDQLDLNPVRPEEIRGPHDSAGLFIPSLR